MQSRPIVRTIVAVGAAFGVWSTMLNASAATAQPCVGDCNSNLRVTPDEILSLVSIALGHAAVTECAAGNVREDLRIDVGEILAAVRTAAGGECTASGCTTATVTVSLDYDPNAVPDVTGLVVTLSYPLSVSIPGSGTDESVVARFTDLNPGGGFFDVQDVNTDTDGVDDQVRNAYVATATIPPGGFENVQFDCAPGASTPTAAAFSCAVPQASDSTGFPVDGITCSIAVATP